VTNSEFDPVLQNSLHEEPLEVGDESLIDRPIRVRSVFLSDVHLGATGCKTQAIQDFLYHIECENLYLVGDIIDGWITRDKRWSQEHSNVIRTLLGMAKNGVRVYLTPGNHDAFLRKMNGLEFGLIEIDHSFKHTCVDGREFLVVHGDLFDPTCKKHSWLAWMGAWGYEYLQMFNARVNERRLSSKRKGLDFASKLKRLTKTLFSSREKFDGVVIESAREQGFDGVVCGHVHRPEIREADGFTYINTGDWVENCTAVLEELDGRIHLISWKRESEPALSRRKVAKLRKVAAKGKRK
jgi:UDP-2,3-diacylglucosamine pyrophosphatase LpxH